jgi:putative two-component system response regulator
MHSQIRSVPRLLVVDDSPGIAAVLEHLLVAEGYHVEIAHDGAEALARVAIRVPDLLLLDLDMPHVDGYEVCRRLKADPATRLTPILIITAQDILDAKLKAWDFGADDLLTKPFQPVEVLARCRSLLRIKALVDELDSAHAVVLALARALEAKSQYTQGHADRVTIYALALAHEVGLSAAEVDLLRLGAVLHDVGKIGIPDAILDKPGSLTSAEYAVVKRHPDQGARIVAPLRSLRAVVPLIRWHHERMDGAGYPDGLFGAAIPLVVRILAVADVYDALSNPRPYREAMPPARCLEILDENAASGGLDTELVRCFNQARSAPRAAGAPLAAPIGTP